MTKNTTPTPVYLDTGMHPGLEVKGLTPPDNTFQLSLSDSITIYESTPLILKHSICHKLDRVKTPPNNNISVILTICDDVRSLQFRCMLR